MAEKVKRWDEIEQWKDKDRCPICNSKLQKRWEGLVCRNTCPLNFKLGCGWVYVQSKKNKLFWTLKYDFDIDRHENIKKWLFLKSKMIYDKKYCEICGKDNFLQVHHILPRSSHPELSLDIENLMVLCKDCHKKIHEKDKYKFGYN